MLGGTAALLRWLAFAQTPFANGWDSYFYLIQLKSWIETGHMHSPEASLIYPLMRCCVWLTGDYVSGYKLCAAGLAGCLTGLVAWGGRAWGGGLFAPGPPAAPITAPLNTPPPTPPPPGRGAVPRSNRLPSPEGEGLGVGYSKGPGNTKKPPLSYPPAALFPNFLPALLLLYSPQLTFFAAQYPKNLLGLVLFLALVFSLPERPQRRWTSWAMPLMWLIVNYFGHRLTFVLALFYLLFWVLWAFGKNLKSLLPVRVVVISGLVFVGGVLASRLFPGLFHLSDLERLGGVLGHGIQFAPWSFVQDFGPSRMSGWWLAEIAVAVLLLVLTAVRLAAKPWRKTVTLRSKALFTLGLVLLFPGLEWSMTGVACRLFMVYGLLAPLMAFDGGFLNKKLSSALGGLLVAGALFSWKSYSPALHDPNYRLFEQLTASVCADETYRSSRPELLIAPNALAEYFTFTTGTDAMPWLPEYPVDSTRLWRIAGQMRQQTVEYYARGPVRRLPGAYLLLREDHWQQALERARAEADTAYVTQATGWPNPARIRPTYLLRRKSGG